MKQIYLIHGWDGTPDSDWFPWVKQQLSAQGYYVNTPEMPETAAPTIEKWVGKLEEIVIDLNDEMILIGHSIGCQTILRFLEKQPESVKVGPIIFVAPWFTLQGLDTKEEEIAKPWIETPIDFAKVLRHTNSITTIFSLDDPVVPTENIKMFEEKLDAQTLIFENKRHFNETVDEDLLEIIQTEIV